MHLALNQEQYIILMYLTFQCKMIVILSKCYLKVISKALNFTEVNLVGICQLNKYFRF